MHSPSAISPGAPAKWELEQYLGELTRYPERDFYRPNLFVNTPDLLPYHLQGGEPWVFKSRVALAATLSGSYGIYSGFELLEHDAIPGREEYLDSEKYQIKQRDWDQPGNIKAYIAALNRIRNDNAALQQTENLRFLGSRGRRDDRLCQGGGRSSQHRRSRSSPSRAMCANSGCRSATSRLTPAGTPPRHRTRKSHHRRTVPHRMGRDQIAYRSRPRSGAAVPLPGVRCTP